MRFPLAILLATAATIVLAHPKVVISQDKVGDNEVVAQLKRLADRVLLSDTGNVVELVIGMGSLAASPSHALPTCTSGTWVCIATSGSALRSTVFGLQASIVRVNFPGDLTVWSFAASPSHARPTCTNGTWL